MRLKQKKLEQNVKSQKLREKLNIKIGRKEAKILKSSIGESLFYEDQKKLNFILGRI